MYQFYRRWDRRVPFTVSRIMSASEGSGANDAMATSEGALVDSQPMQTGPTQPVPEMATTFDEHVWHVVQDVLHRNRETVNPSHMLWLQRQTSRNLVRTLELDRREAELNRREANLRRQRQKCHAGNNRTRTPSEPPECRSSA